MKVVNYDSAELPKAIPGKQTGRVTLLLHEMFLFNTESDLTH